MHNPTSIVSAVDHYIHNYPSRPKIASPLLFQYSRTIIPYRHRIRVHVSAYLHRLESSRIVASSQKDTLVIRLATIPHTPRLSYHSFTSTHRTPTFHADPEVERSLSYHRSHQQQHHVRNQLRALRRTTNEAVATRPRRPHWPNRPQSLHLYIS